MFLSRMLVRKKTFLSPFKKVFYFYNLILLLEIIITIVIKLVFFGF